jgi:hypothetical protein
VGSTDRYGLVVVAVPMTAVLVPMVPVAVMAATHAPHGDTARLAELRPFPHHARFDPVRVRNELGAEPHRVGRAGLACFGHTILGRGGVEADQKCADGQRQPKRETHGTHMVCSPFARVAPAPAHTSGELVARRWSGRMRPVPIHKIGLKMPSTRRQWVPQAEFQSPRTPTLGGWPDMARRRLR